MLLPAASAASAGVGAGAGALGVVVPRLDARLLAMWLLVAVEAVEAVVGAVAVDTVVLHGLGYALVGRCRGVASIQIVRATAAAALGLGAFMLGEAEGRRDGRQNT
jgi:hypothetical protein